jgi:two-component system probable response regulator PhcQ
VTEELRLPTVLFVDSDLACLGLVERALYDELWRLLTTSDPLRALPLLEWEGVDVLVADLQMPGVDGVELLARARKLFPWIPRLALTGTMDAERIARAINEAEVFRFLRKPVQMDEVREAIREALRRRDLFRPAEAAERAGARRAEALRDLQAKHPGIETRGVRDGVHVLSEDRLADLRQRFLATPFEGVLPE